MDEVAHPLVSEPLGEGGRVDDVAKEHGNLLDFAGKRAHRSLRLGFRRIGRGGRLLKTRRIEGGAALPTEFMSGRVGSAARRTYRTKWRAALPAELHAGRVVGIAS